MELFKEVVTDKAYRLLQGIMQIPAFKDFRLVGGTALGLQIGHRRSIDLDFFTQKEFEVTLTKQLNFSYKTSILNNNSIEIFSGDIKVMFMYFGFPLRKDVHEVDGIRLADPVDIGLMKLLGLQGRSTKKDIIDLYCIDGSVMPLEELLEIFENFYPKESFSSYTSIKQFLDKSFFDNEPMPDMIKNIEWEEALQLVSGKLVSHIAKLIA